MVFIGNHTGGGGEGLKATACLKAASFCLSLRYFYDYNNSYTATLPCKKYGTCILDSQHSTSLNTI